MPVTILPESSTSVAYPLVREMRLMKSVKAILGLLKKSVCCNLKEKPA